MHKLISGLLFFFIVLCATAQTTAPGFEITDGGQLSWNLITGHSSELIESTYRWRNYLEETDSTINTDTLTSNEIYFNDLAGYRLDGEPLKVLPGFDGPSWWPIIPYLFLGDIYTVPVREPQWDTLYYHTENFSCNGNYSITTYNNYLHTDKFGNPDSLVNAQTYRVGEVEQESYRGTYRMFTKDSGYVDSIKYYYAMQDENAYQFYPTGRYDYSYDGDLLKRIVISKTNDRPLVDVDSVLQQMSYVLSEHTIASWDTLNNWLNRTRDDRSISGWLEFKYNDGMLTEMLVYSDMESVIYHYTWTYNGDRVVSFNIDESFGTDMRYLFSYHPNETLDSIAFTSHSHYDDQGDGHEAETIRYKMVYNSDGKLVRWR